MPEKNKKRKRYFLVDYENVKTAGLQGIEDLEKNDSIIIFYSANADRITFQLHDQINRTKAKVSTIGVDTVGQNALDFQLSSYIGYILGKKSGCECFIVSKDRGFENVCNFWRTRGIRVRIISGISESSKEASVKKSELKSAIKELGFSKEEAEIIKNLISENVKNDKLALPQMKININNELCKQFGNEKAKIIYAKLKPFIK